MVQKIIEMISQGIPDQLQLIVDQISLENAYLRALSLAKEKYNIIGTNIDFLTPANVVEIYSIIKKKQKSFAKFRFYYERQNPANCSWFENELRIYIWVLMCYLFLNKKDISGLVILFKLFQTQDDWSFFKPIFYNRQPILFEFQAILLLKNKNSKWTELEIKLLQKIVKQKNPQSRIKSLKNKWNAISRELYVQSDKAYVKTPKQCRQRWLNYLDPSKVHCAWTKQEDLTLLSSIRQNGKRWAYTVKKLLKKRTEHMVKNRFNSLINNQKKKIGKIRGQNQLLKCALDTVKKEIQQEKEQKRQKLTKQASVKVEQPKDDSLIIKIHNQVIIPKIKKTKCSKQKVPKSSTGQVKMEFEELEQIYSRLGQTRREPEIDYKPESMKTMPAENNKIQKLQEQQPQLFEDNGSIMEFNPFEEATPDNEFLAPNFYFSSEYSQNSEARSRISSVDVTNTINVNFDNIYSFK